MLTVPQGSTYFDLRNLAEKNWRWVYGNRAFHYIPWTQSDDDLRLFRYRRVNVPVSIRFVRVSGGVSLDELSAGTTLYLYSGLFPDGQDSSFSTNQERGFQEGIVGTDNPGTTVVRTNRKTINSGIDIAGYVTCMPGSWARFVTKLEVSAFTGSGLDRNVTSVPLSLDVPRYQWVPVHVFSSLDLAGSISFGSAPTIRLGGDWVRVDVRVD